MNAKGAYLDSSAFVKSVLREAETTALEAFLERYDRVVSSELLETEVRRAVLRNSELHVAALDQRLNSVSMVGITRDILVAAGWLRPAGIRSLDAIHLATALWLREEVDCIVTYDKRMADAATLVGLSVQHPA